MRKLKNKYSKQAISPARLGQRFHNQVREYYYITNIQKDKFKRYGDQAGFNISSLFKINKQIETV
jgi:hypothetical protein